MRNWGPGAVWAGREAPHGEGLTSQTHFLLSVLSFMFLWAVFLYSKTWIGNKSVLKNVKICDLINHNLSYMPPIFKYLSGVTGAVIPSGDQEVLAVT